MGGQQGIMRYASHTIFVLVGRIGSNLPRPFFCVQTKHSRELVEGQLLLLNRAKLSRINNL